MRHFTSVTQLGSLDEAFAKARYVKENPFADQALGTNKTLVIGKELEIRRVLSETHLFSSAFVVDKGPEKEGVPEWFELTGAGWGHGVGLCQIGAAVMGEKGYNYNEILLHYYKGADIRKLY